MQDYNNDFSEEDTKIETSSSLLFNKPITERRRSQPIQIDKNIVWTTEMILKLIAAVKKSQCLWDIQYPDYNDPLKRVAAWKHIEEDTFNNSIPLVQLQVNCQIKCYVYV